MSENRTGKYIKYALGEILLVMIGILLALQVNNWNEERKIKRTEIKLLVALEEEMTENQKLLSQALSIHKRLDSSTINILDNWKKLTNQEKIQHIANQRHYFTMDLVSGVVKSIISGNTLSFISSDSIINFISTWEDKVKDIYENEELDAYYANNLMIPYLYNNLSVKDLISYSYNNYINSVFLSQVNKIVKENKFEGILLQRRYNMQTGLAEIQALKEEVKLIIKHTKTIINEYKEG
jgi:hypothetical protein